MQPVMQRFLRTVPPNASNSTLAASNASFQRFASQRHTEVGQTVRISEAFELQRIGLQFELATVALPGFRDYPDGTNWSILSQYVQILEPTDELQISLSLILYRSADSDRVPTIRRMTSGFGGVPMRERDAIRISDVEVVSDQRLTGRVTTRQDAISSLDLTEPVLLEPGYYIVAFRIDHEPGDVDLLDFRIFGTESGEETDERPPPEGPCVYERTTDPYPEGAFFWRDGEHFIPAFAKVGACTNRFDAVGNPIEVMNPGDIGLDLYGVGAD